MGRVIRLQAQDIDIFIEHMRIAPGSLEHLYPEPKSATEPRSTSDVRPSDDLLGAAASAHHRRTQAAIAASGMWTTAVGSPSRRTLTTSAPTLVRAPATAIPSPR